MPDLDDARLLAAILAGQEEEGAVAELPPERLRAFAEGKAEPTPAEAAALLASPVARRELALLRRLSRLRRSAGQAGAAANDNLLEPVRRAASPHRGGAPRVYIDYDGARHGVQDVLELECRWATVVVEPGFSGDSDHHQGRLGEAEPLFQEALAGAQAALGPRHPETLRSMHSLAGLYAKQGRLGEAEALLREALEGQRAALGPRHPDTLAGLANLAALYQAQGRHPEAEALLREAEPLLLISVRLKPGIEGGVADRRVEVYEDDPHGVVWAAGRTDAAGELHQPWRHPGLHPRDRRPAGGLRVVID